MERRSYSCLQRLSLPTSSCRRLGTESRRESGRRARDRASPWAGRFVGSESSAAGTSGVPVGAAPSTSGAAWSGRRRSITSHRIGWSSVALCSSELRLWPRSRGQSAVTSEVSRSSRPFSAFCSGSWNGIHQAAIAVGTAGIRTEPSTRALTPEWTGYGVERNRKGTVPSRRSRPRERERRLGHRRPTRRSSGTARVRSPIRLRDRAGHGLQTSFPVVWSRQSVFSATMFTAPSWRSKRAGGARGPAKARFLSRTKKE